MLTKLNHREARQLQLRLFQLQPAAIEGPMTEAAINVARLDTLLEIVPRVSSIREYYLSVPS